MTQTDLEMIIMHSKEVYSAKNMINDICVHSLIPFSTVKSGIKKHHVLVARRLMMYFLREKFGLTLKKIGRTLNKDHATVKYNVEWLKSRIDQIDDLPEYKEIFHLINNKYEKVHRTR